MTELPRGWASGPLSDFVTPRGERVSPADFPEMPFIGMDHVEAHTTRIVGSVPSRQMKSSASRFRKNDVLYGRLRPYLNKVAQPNFDGLASGEFIVFEGNERIDPSFLRYRLHARDFVNFASHLNEGDRPRVNFGQIGGFDILVPPPKEQRRIVERIEILFDEIDRGVESLRDAQRAIGLYRQSLLKSAFEGRLTADWRAGNSDKLESAETLLARIGDGREAVNQASLDNWKRRLADWERCGKAGRRPPKPRRAKPPSKLGVSRSSNSEASPGGWLLLTAESVGTVQLGRQRSPKNRSKDFPTKYVRAANITEQGLALDDLLDMDFLPHELHTYRLEEGDLLLAEASGSVEQVGKAAIWQGEVQDCCFQNTVIRHRPHCHDFAIYLLWLYRHFYVSGKFAQVAGGVGINHLSASRFAQIPLPICSPAEQSEIVRILEGRLESADALQAEIDANLARAEALRQSILKKAFSGKLVPQNPDAEPARALLARIRASRDGNSTTKRRRPARRRARATDPP